MRSCLIITTVFVGVISASKVSVGDVNLPILTYPEVNYVTHSGVETFVYLNQSEYPDNGCGINCIYQKPQYQNFVVGSSIWLYRAKIDSIYLPIDSNIYPSIYYHVDSCLYGSNQYINYADSLDVRGNRQRSTYPIKYWQSFIGKSILVVSGFNLYKNRIPPTGEYLITDAYNFDNYWYFSQGDTVWNDALHYGVPTYLNILIDSLRADSIRLANTPVLSIPTVTAEPVEIWSLSGENLWSGRDWRKSGLPTGVYLLKNRDVQRVVWVE